MFWHFGISNSLKNSQQVTMFTTMSNITQKKKKKKYKINTMKTVMSMDHTLWRALCF
jgi:hypothetical protein